MRDYFPRHGRSSRLAHHMMKMTATVQANFDYESEADAVDKIRTAYGVSSIVTALYAASPIADGRPTGYKSFRAAIWLETDEDRCGLLPFVFEPGFCFRDYVEWALDVPMFFVVRDGGYRPAERDDVPALHRGGVRGRDRDDARLGDPSVDAVPRGPPEALHRAARAPTRGRCRWRSALGALWRGLLDDRDARAAAWELVAKPSVRRARGAAARGAARGAAGAPRRPAAAGAGARADAGSPTRASRGCRAARTIARCSRRCGATRPPAARRPTTCSTTSTRRGAIRRSWWRSGSCARRSWSRSFRSRRSACSVGAGVVRGADAQVARRHVELEEREHARVDDLLPQLVRVVGLAVAQAAHPLVEVDLGALAARVGRRQHLIVGELPDRVARELAVPGGAAPRAQVAVAPVERA